MNLQIVYTYIERSIRPMYASSTPLVKSGCKTLFLKLLSQISPTVRTIRTVASLGGVLSQSYLLIEFKAQRRTEHHRERDDRKNVLHSSQQQYQHFMKRDYPDSQRRACPYHKNCKKISGLIQLFHGL